MKYLTLIPGLLGLALACPVAGAPQAKSPSKSTQIQGLRVWVTPEHTRLMFETQGPAVHRLATTDPGLILDIKNASLQTPLPATLDQAPVVSGLRTASLRDGRDLRILVDLKQRVPAKTYLLPGNEVYGQRLVVDLEVRTDAKPAPSPAPAPEARAEPPAPASAPPKTTEAAVAKPAKAEPKTEPKAEPRTEPKSAVEVEREQEFIVAIDPGHGGDDPGAIGPSGVQEKDIALAIARRLERLIDAEPGMRAVLTRKGDYNLGLRQRIKKAHKAKADLFISIHADAVDEPSVGGASVYTLSQRGASSEAARLQAEKENRAELVTGVELDGKDPELASMLLEISQSGAMESSHRVARRLLSRLKEVGRMRKTQVQHAAFAVLKAPDIPSVLVETAYITNPEEEAKLRDPAHQERLAGALAGGIRQHFAGQPRPTGAQVAKAAAQRPPARRHVVGAGETLSGVAQQYRVAMSELRVANRLANNSVRVGQVLRIPES